MRQTHLWMALIGVMAIPALSQVCTVKLQPNELKDPAWAYLYEMGLSEQPPEGTGAMPDFGKAKPWYGELKLGDGKPVLMAVAVEGGEPVPLPPPADDSAQTVVEVRGEPKLCAWLDRNGDRALADEQPLAFAKEQTESLGENLVTPEIKVPVTYKLADGTDLQRDLRFRLATYPFAMSQPMLMMALSEAWCGELELGADKLRLWLHDGNGDAKLAVADMSRGMPDMLSIAKAGEELPSASGRPLTRHVQHAGTFYRVEVRPDGSEITLSPMTDKPAKLVFTATDGKGRKLPVRSLMVYGENYYGQLDLSGDATSLPPGEYQTNYMLGGKPNAPLYSFTPTDPLTLTRGETTKLTCGGPLKLSITPSSSWSQGGTADISVNVALQTAAGHSFSLVQSSPKVAGAKVEVFTTSFHRIATATAQPG